MDLISWANDLLCSLLEVPDNVKEERAAAAAAAVVVLVAKSVLLLVLVGPLIECRLRDSHPTPAGRSVNTFYLSDLPGIFFG